MKRTIVTFSIALLGGCTGSKEVRHFSVPIVVDGSALAPSTNELGWTVELTACQLAIEDLEFTTGGETHASLRDRLQSLIVPAARAHPGHVAGGEVIGEMRGSFFVDWIDEDGRELGKADLIAGRYDGLNFSFRSSSEGSLDGHSAVLVGVAARAAETISFSAFVDLDLTVPMVGAELDLDLETPAGLTIGLQLVPDDPYDNDSLFQFLDFAAYDHDQDGQIEILPDNTAHNILRRTLQSHDHYRAVARQEG